MSFGCGILLNKEFNSSVLLFTCSKADNLISPQFFFAFVDENGYAFFLVSPDIICTRHDS